MIVMCRCSVVSAKDICRCLPWGEYITLVGGGRGFFYTETGFASVAFLSSTNFNYFTVSAAISAGPCEKVQPTYLQNCFPVNLFFVIFRDFLLSNKRK